MNKPRSFFVEIQLFVDPFESKEYIHSCLEMVQVAVIGGNPIRGDIRDEAGTKIASFGIGVVEHGRAPKEGSPSAN